MAKMAAAPHVSRILQKLKLRTWAERLASDDVEYDEVEDDDVSLLDDRVDEVKVM